MKSILFKILAVTTVIALIIVGLFLYFASLVLSKQPDNISINTLDYNAWISVNQKINKEMDFIKKGRQLDKERTVVFTKQETNAMLDMSVRTKNAYGKEREQYVIQKIYFTGEDFIADIYFKINTLNPFGEIINCQLVFVPEIIDKTVVIKFKKVRLGDWKAPEFLINMILDKNQSSINSNEVIESLTMAVNDFQIKNNEIYIKYIPVELIKFLHSKLAIKAIQPG